MELASAAGLWVRSAEAATAEEGMPAQRAEDLPNPRPSPLAPGQQRQSRPPAGARAYHSPSSTGSAVSPLGLSFSPVRAEHGL